MWTHPDRAGGLGFLGEANRLFAIFIFAYGATASRVLGREAVPGREADSCIAILTVVLADRPPLPFAEIGSPFSPGDFRGTSFLKSECLRITGHTSPLMSSGRHELTQAPTVSTYAANDRTTFLSKTTAPTTASPLASTLNSLSGTVNSVKPHSKQTRSFGNDHTMGSSRRLSPGKWIATSPLNAR